MAAVSHIQLLRGNTAAASAYVALVGEQVYDLEKKTIRVGDGVTAGGTVLAKENIKLKTDSDALLKFNGVAESDHAADISITLDKPLVAGAVVTAIAADKPVKGKALAAALISSKADNALVAASGTDEDGLLYVAPAESAEDLVDANEKFIFVDATSKKLKSNMQLSITTADHTLHVKSGADGDVEVASVQLPTAGLLKSAEVVDEKPVEGGGSIPGHFLKLVFELTDGTEKTEYIDLEELVDVYTAGDGIKVDASDDHKFVLNTAATEPVMVNASGNVTLRLGDGLKNDAGTAKISLAASDNQARFNTSGELHVPCDYGTLD